MPLEGATWTVIIKFCASAVTIGKHTTGLCDNINLFKHISDVIYSSTTDNEYDCPPASSPLHVAVGMRDIGMAYIFPT